MAIIESSKWEEALQCKWSTDTRTTPFKELIKEMPCKLKAMYHYVSANALCGEDELTVAGDDEHTCRR